MARNRLIVALDVKTAQEARELYHQLRDTSGMFKVGSQLFTAAGPSIVRELVDSGAEVFLDLKFHDIPNTVAAAGVEAARLGVSIFNIHAAGGTEMMTRTANAVRDACEREQLKKPSVIAVTVLTSINDQILTEVGVDHGVGEQVQKLARLAEASGMDGVVASPREITAIRRAVTRDDFLIVTPSVRAAGEEKSDQKRTMTPAEAVGAGANYIVVGRPITGAPDPRAAAIRIVEELERSLS